MPDPPRPEHDVKRLSFPPAGHHWAPTKGINNMSNQHPSLIVAIYRVIWLAVVVGAIIAVCSWADSNSKPEPETPSWITQP
jgi:hypothetical protein